MTQLISITINLVTVMSLVVMVIKPCHYLIKSDVSYFHSQGSKMFHFNLEQSSVEALQSQSPSKLINISHCKHGKGGKLDDLKINTLAQNYTNQNNPKKP